MDAERANLVNDTVYELILSVLYELLAIASEGESPALYTSLC